MRGAAQGPRNIAPREAKTWAHIKLIPMDASNPNKSQSGGYLSCVQTPDRMIHLLSSQRYYRFNLAWLMQPLAASAVVHN